MKKIFVQDRRLTFDLKEVGLGLCQPLGHLQPSYGRHWFQTDVVEHVQTQCAIRDVEDSVMETGAH